MIDTAFHGVWRIVWMAGWDQDFVDMEVPGHVTFEGGRSATFQFGLVQGDMDCHPDARHPQRVEFSWSGSDECDEASGRGHAEIVNGELQGHLWFHNGDDSAFRAVRQGAPAKVPRKSGKSGSSPA